MKFHSSEMYSHVLDTLSESELFFINYCLMLWHGDQSKDARLALAPFCFLAIVSLNRLITIL